MIQALCRVCNLDGQCRRIGKELVCEHCVNKYNLIRTLVVEATPLDQLAEKES